MKRLHLHLFVLAFCLAGYGWIAWNAAPAWGGAAGATPTLCMMKLATGLPCPACGATRSLELLVGGDLAGSAAMNPVGILLAIALVIFPPWIISDSITGRETFFTFTRAVDRVFSGRRAFALAGVALVLANWSWNLLKGL